jgi:O-Antigen ligase
MSGVDVRADLEGGKSWRELGAVRLQETACVLLVGALVLAPCLYGSTRVWTMRLLAGVLTVVAGCWFGSGWCGRRLQGLPGRAVTVVVFLLVAGWLKALIGPVMAPDAFGVEHFAELAGRWPGSFISRNPVEAMWLMSGLLGAFLLVVDMATTGAWRTRFYRLVVVTGSVLVLLGFLQVVTGARGIFWREEARPAASAFFATFFEESVGVAFVSLVWPLAAGGLLGRLSVSGALSKAEWRITAIWGAMVAVGWLGLVAMGSLLGLAVGGALAMLLAVWLLWRVPRVLLRSYFLRAGLVGGACALILAAGWLVGGKALAFHSHWSRLQAVLATERPEEAGEVTFGVGPDGLILSDENPTDPDFAQRQRQKLLMVPWKMIPKSGLLGFGPGSWATAFPRGSDDALLRSHYLSMQFVHHDYLQALVEWGILGVAAWVILFLGGIRAGVYRLRRYRSKGGRIGEKEGMIAGALAGLCGVLVCAWWSFPLQVPSIQLYVAVVLGLLWSAGERQGWSRGEGAQDVIPKPAAN